ncbi:MAG: hypothetical protein IJ639_08565 [Ruminococcus sp.]|nr:hypothetical protein [Ruminococcus sp.]
MPNNRYIEKDALTDVARKAEYLSSTLADIEQDYFGKIDYRETVAFEANRLRRYICMCFDISHALTKELHEYGIYCFDKEVVA